MDQPAGGFGQIDYGNCLDENSSTFGPNHLQHILLTDPMYCGAAAGGDMWEEETRQSPTWNMMVGLVRLAHHRLIMVGAHHRRRNHPIIQQSGAHWLTSLGDLWRCKDKFRLQTSLAARQRPTLLGKAKTWASRGWGEESAACWWRVTD